MSYEKNEQRYIRFDGILQENMLFDFRSGWETTRIHRRPKKGSGEYVLELLDQKEHALTRVSPKINFRDGCATEDNALMAATRVVAYVPYHPAARRLVFRREDFTIFEASVAEEPPSIELNSVDPGKENTLKIDWSAKSSGERSLTYNIIYVVNGERFFPLAKGLEESEATVELHNVPGGEEAQIAVLATDGIRSSFVISEPFETEQKNPQVWIQQPEDEATLPPDQPISLIGQALDVAGASLPDQGLIWEVDGEVIAEGSRVALASNLKPGKHEMTLSYRVEDNKDRVSQSITIEVNERNEAQERYQKIKNRLK